MNNSHLDFLREQKRAFLNGTKSIIETLSFGYFWIDDQTPLTEVHRVIGMFAPKTPTKPLIRIGAYGDGGYLVPDDLEGICASISPGISTEVSFDLAVAELGIDVFMADGSVSDVPHKHPRFHFLQKFLGLVDDEQNIRLETYVNDYAPEGDLLLQMDIEGSEFAVIADTPDDILKRFRIIIIELHGLEHVFGSRSIVNIDVMLSKLLRHFAVVHIHPNNCCGSVTRHGIEIPRVLELTLQRLDRDPSFTSQQVRLPHPLDIDNAPKKPSISLGSLSP